MTDGGDTMLNSYCIDEKENSEFQKSGEKLPKIFESKISSLKSSLNEGKNFGNIVKSREYGVMIARYDELRHQNQ